MELLATGGTSPWWLHGNRKQKEAVDVWVWCTVKSPKLSISLNRFPGTKPRGGFHLPPTYSPNAAVSYFELFQLKLGLELKDLFGEI